MMINTHKLIPTIGIIVFLLLIGGTSAYAEKSIPGDSLYKIKIYINEPAAGIFTLSKEEKAEWQERLIERRLDEAQKLISQNKFDEQTRTYIQGKIENNLNKFNTNINNLVLKQNESAESSNLNIRLQASLNAYKSILENLTLNTETTENTKKETEKLLSIIDQSINEEQIELENLQSYDTTEINNTSSLEKQKEAKDLLLSIKLSYQRERMNLSENIQKKIDSKLAVSETTLKEGDEFLASLDYQNSMDRFKKVINTLNEAKLLMLSNTIKSEAEDDIYYDDDNDDYSNSKHIDDLEFDEEEDEDYDD